VISDVETLRKEVENLKTMVSILLSPQVKIEDVRRIAENKQRLLEELKKRGLTTSV